MNHDPRWRWINAPGKHQALHRYHGCIGIILTDTDRDRPVFYTWDPLGGPLGHPAAVKIDLPGWGLTSTLDTAPQHTKDRLASLTPPKPAAPPEPSEADLLYETWLQSQLRSQHWKRHPYRRLEGPAYLDPGFIDRLANAAIGVCLAGREGPLSMRLAAHWELREGIIDGLLDYHGLGMQPDRWEDFWYALGYDIGQLSCRVTR